MIAFLLIALLSFCAMEFVSYGVHRFLYHRIFWFIHRSHHVPRTGPFERNDLFPVVFAGASCLLIFAGLERGPFSLYLGAGLGITAYGAVYFIVHDLYIHRRVKRLAFRIPFLLAAKKAHAVHHRTGGEPYGLLLFPRVDELRGSGVTETDAV
jgi:beta-carotene 3-hydroxylase